MRLTRPAFGDPMIYGRGHNGRLCMNRFALKLAFASLLAAPMFIGCDRTVSESSKVERKSDGTMVSDNEKTTQSPDGVRQTTTEHKVVK
jgi:hypothetical protein